MATVGEDLQPERPPLWGWGPGQEGADYQPLPGSLDRGEHRVGRAPSADPLRPSPLAPAGLSGSAEALRALYFSFLEPRGMKSQKRKPWLWPVRLRGGPLKTRNSSRACKDIREGSRKGVAWKGGCPLLFRRPGLLQAGGSCSVTQAVSPLAQGPSTAAQTDALEIEEPSFHMVLVAKIVFRSILLKSHENNWHIQIFPYE